jgi:hypothetical protein
MEPNHEFAVKELLWRQKYPVDPKAGLTLFATVLEDDAGRRLFVYADGDRIEAFDRDGKPIPIRRTPFTTQEPSCKPQAHLVDLDVGGDAPPSTACQCSAERTALVAAGVKVCYVQVGTIWIQITCPPGVC